MTSYCRLRQLELEKYFTKDLEPKSSRKEKSWGEQKLTGIRWYIYHWSCLILLWHDSDARFSRKFAFNVVYTFVLT